MQSRAGFIVRYWIHWILFFETARIIFLLKNSAESKAAGTAALWGSLWHGLRMDASMAAYITLPVILLLMLGLFIKLFEQRLLYQVYTGIVLFGCLLLILIDLNLFQAWGFRIDASFLKYLRNPREVYASISHLPLLAIFFLFAAGYAFFLFVFVKKIASSFKRFRHVFNRWLALGLFVLMAGLLIIPMRGGLQLAPLNQSGVYFSSNNFANQAAINAPWNFMYSVNHHTESTVNPFVYMDAKLAQQAVDSLFVKPAPGSLPPVDSTPPNVIVLVVESFTAKAIDQTWEGKEITPGFNRLKKEGIYFSDIYASGDRTDKGIVAVMSGFPAQPTTSIVKTPAKAAKLPMLPAILKSRGYQTAFYYGGELEFANMKAYLLGGGFEQFITINDFDKKDQNSKWGAHDGVVMNRFFADLTKAKPPFFYSWLTLSSHEPFETPTPSIFRGREDVSLFLNSIHYTDSILNALVQQCRLQPWWKHTILAIVADHGHKLPATGKRADDFRIPLLVLGGEAESHPQVIGPTGSQTDLPATLLSMLHLPSDRFRWSKNLLDSSTKHWAYFSFNNGFGYAAPGKVLVFDNVGKLPIEQLGPVTPADIQTGKALQQLTFQSYLDQ